MAIGTSKSGVLGSGSVPAGCITINSTTVWVAPAGVRSVSVYGHGGAGNAGSAGNTGSTGNSGNSGNPGNAGGGGGGGGGGPGSSQIIGHQLYPPYGGHILQNNSYRTFGGDGWNAGRGGPIGCAPQTSQVANSTMINCHRGNNTGAAPYYSGLASSGSTGAAGNAGSGGSGGSSGGAGNPGSAGNAGASSTALGITFPGGNAGNAGAGGSGGAGGSAGNSGPGGTAGTGGGGGHGSHFYQVTGQGATSGGYYTFGVGGLAGQGSGNYSFVMSQNLAYFNAIYCASGIGAAGPYGSAKFPPFGCNAVHGGGQHGKYFTISDTKFGNAGQLRYGTIGNGGCGYSCQACTSSYCNTNSLIRGGPGGDGAGNNRYGVNTACRSASSGGVGGRGATPPAGSYGSQWAYPQGGYYLNNISNNQQHTLPQGPSQVLNDSAMYTGGGGGGGSVQTAAPYQHPSQYNLQRNGPFMYIAGGGGGGGGKGQLGGAGGAGGSGSAGNPGSPGNPGGSATPSTSNCVMVTSGGSYPITVAPGSSVKISWKSQ